MRVCATPGHTRPTSEFQRARVRSLSASSRLDLPHRDSTTPPGSVSSRHILAQRVCRTVSVGVLLLRCSLRLKPVLPLSIADVAQVPRLIAFTDQAVTQTIRGPQAVSDYRFRWRNKYLLCFCMYVCSRLSLGLSSMFRFRLSYLGRPVTKCIARNGRGAPTQNENYLISGAP